MRVLIEAFSTPGCARCATAREALRKVAGEVCGERLAWRDVNVLDELDYAVELGVLTPPSLAINGKLVFPALPTPARLRNELVRLLAERKGD